MLVSLTLVLHEYCITFHHEVERFWKPTRLSWSIILFFINRYLLLLGTFPAMASHFLISSVHNKVVICRSLVSYNRYFTVAIELNVGALLILRTYALYERSRKILVLLVGAYIVACAIAFWAVFTGGPPSEGMLGEYYAMPGCPWSGTTFTSHKHAVAWGGVLAFDLLIFVLTVLKTLASHGWVKSDLHLLLLRDGSMYFGVMIVTNIANIILLVYGGKFTSGLLGTPMNVIASVLITRLMLNLRDPSLSPRALSMPTVHPGTLAFRHTSRQAFSTFEEAR